VDRLLACPAFDPATGYSLRSAWDQLEKNNYLTPAQQRQINAQLNQGTKGIAKIGDKIGNLGKLVDNPDVKVNWGDAREHALNRMSKHGITQEMFEHWVKDGKAIQQDGNIYLFLTKEGVAVISKEGIPQTAYTSAQFRDHIKNAITQIYGR
jgi:uncharacterized protein YecE (DUF72 family)